MDAMLDEKLDLDGFWAAYVGNMTPLEFMNRQYSPDIRECVAEYVSLLPQLFGIVRRQTWKEAFGAPSQFRKDAVLAALVDKLEMTEAEWRPHLNQRPRPEPAPEPAPVAVDASAAPEQHVGVEWTPEQNFDEAHAVDSLETGASEEFAAPEGAAAEEAKDGDA